MLTLFIVPDDKGSFTEKTVESFGTSELFDEDTLTVAHRLDHRDIGKALQQYPVETEWFGYLFSNEWIQESLRDALPIFFKDPKYKVLTLMKRSRVDGEIKNFQAPRIFRRGVSIIEMMPVGVDALEYVRVLDGWVEDDTVGSQNK